jgi:polyisoprenyl-phosphate glycosyltransferase
MSLDRPLISAVVPVYNEEGNVEALLTRLRAVESALGLDLEIVFVDDGSRDRTVETLRRLWHADRRFRVVRLSRNFGHQTAITAGMEHATGDAVVVMDADLQDPPELVGEMVRRWQEGYDVVYAVRAARKGETLFKRSTAAMFYRLIRRITRVDIPLDTGDFRLVSRRVIEDLRRMPERHRFVRGLVAWVGYPQIGVPYERDERLSGETKYPLWRMARFALDGITSFSFAPLQIATAIGFLAALSAFVGIGIVLYYRLFTGIPLPGWASVIISVLFLGGVQLITIGIIGEYLGRVYDEVKGRPLYLVQEKIGFSDGAPAREDSCTS